MKHPDEGSLALAESEEPDVPGEPGEPDVPDEPGEPDVAGASDDSAEPAESGVRRWIRWVVVGLIAVAVAVAAAVAVLGWREVSHQRAEAQEQQVLSISREYLAAMASFDYTELDANRQEIIDNSTPEFAAKYDEMVGALRDIVVAGKGVASAAASHVAVERLSEDSATVIGFVDQQVTNVTAPEGNSQKYRMVVELIKRDGRWVVNDVQTV